MHAIADDETWREVHRPVFMADVVAGALNNGGERPLLCQIDGPTLSVAQVRDETSRFVQALASRGVGAGSRVSLIASNIPECLHLTNALQLLGALYVPLHPLSALGDHVGTVAGSSVGVLVFEAEGFTARALEIAAQVPGLEILAIGASDHAPDLKALGAGFAPAALVPPRAGEHDVTRLGYSGGTTGKPKGIPSIQRTGTLCGLHMMAVWEWPVTPRILSCAPLTHAGGAMFQPALLKGGTFLVLPRFDPLQVMETIERERINCVMLVPTMIYALLDHPRFAEFDLSSLETVFYGASAMNPVRLREAIERIGPVFAQFYGQAEAPMVLTYFRKADHDPDDLVRLASCGLPSPYVRLELHDAQGRPVPDGEPGEIVVQGPLVMDGYDDDALTAEAFRGGWLHTGDVAVRDPGGFLRIVDRTKDMIVTGGFNVYPRDIETVMAGHPAVAEVAVIGVPHPKWGEAVHAVVVLKPGRTASEEELCAPVTLAKGAFQAPKSVAFVEAIPQTPVGKPDKKALRAIYAEA